MGNSKHQLLEQHCQFRKASWSCKLIFRYSTPFHQGYLYLFCMVGAVAGRQNTQLDNTNNQNLRCCWQSAEPSLSAWCTPLQLQPVALTCTVCGFLQILSQMDNRSSTKNMAVGHSSISTETRGGTFICSTNYLHSCIPLNMRPPLLPGWTGHVRGVVSHQGDTHTKMSDLVSDFVSLRVGGLLARGLTEQGNHCI